MAFDSVNYPVSGAEQLLDASLPYARGNNVPFSTKELTEAPCIYVQKLIEKNI